PQFVPPLSLAQLAYEQQIARRLSVTPDNNSPLAMVGGDHVGSSTMVSVDMAQSANEIQWVEYKIKKVNEGKLKRPDAFLWYLETRTRRVLVPDKQMQVEMGVDLYTMEDLKDVVKEARQGLIRLARGDHRVLVKLAQGLTDAQII